MPALPVARGCGSRKEGGVYIETAVGPGGSPIESFLIDPPILDVPDDWLKPHRNPILFEHNGAWHIVIWVGEAYYPSLWDYVEEVRVAGSSRRVAASFDFSKLTAASRQYFVHVRADVFAAPEKPLVPNAKIAVEPHCPIQVHDAHTTEADGLNHCLGYAKYIREDVPKGYAQHVSGGGPAWRQLPCGHRYDIYERPPGVLLPASPALFLQLPITGVAYVRKADGSVDSKVRARVATAKVDTYDVNA